MAKISVEFGLTLPLESGGGFAPSLAIQDIDLDVAVAPQIAQALVAIKQVYGALVGTMAEIVEGSGSEDGGEILAEVDKHITALETKIQPLVVATEKDDVEGAEIDWVDIRKGLGTKIEF